jgi:DNA-directed RNA polymerase subunit RPC12/RpoP
MGEACTLSCSLCSYTQNVFLGFGFRYTDLHSIAEWYEEAEERERIREFMSRQEADFDCYDGLYECKHCGYLLNKVFLHMKSENHAYTNSYACPRCHAPMPPKPLLDVESGVLDCPDCRQGKLAVNFYMDWD